MRRGTRTIATVGAGLLVLAFAAGTSGCNRQSGPTAATTTAAPVRGPEHRFAIQVGDQITNIRLAVHDSERSRGLMNVASLPENEGMLFVWSQPQQMSFYMRNVPIPLDIGFFDAGGVLREIYPMYPGVEDSILSRSDAMKFALEMNHGWFARHHVAVGATIDLAAVGAALKERGYDPERFVAAK